jgi:imidazolonepropionase-like amidohydrolase
MNALILLAAVLLSLDVPQQTAIMNVTVIDTNGGPSRAGVNVILTGDRITAVGAAEVPPGARIVDGTGRYLIPGLWDMHAHIWDRKMLFGAYVSHGVTGVRDMGGVLENWAKWEELIARGETAGPAALVSGQIVDGAKAFAFLFRQAETPAQGRALVRELKERGADFIKVYDRLSRETYLAIAAETKASSLPFAGHVPFSMRASDAARAGQRSIEHLSGIALEVSRDERRLRAAALRELGEAMSYRGEGESPAWKRAYELAREVALDTYDAKKARRLFAEFRRRGTWQVPTLVVRNAADAAEIERLDAAIAHYPEFVRGMIVPAATRERRRDAVTDARFARRKQIVLAMHRAGIGVLAGSDAPNPLSAPGLGLHDELAHLVDAGLTPLEALQAATRNAARFLGHEQLRGSVEAGKVADLVLLDADPLADIRNSRRIAAVILGGRVLLREELAALTPKP